MTLSRYSLLFYLLLFPYGKSFEEIGAWIASASVLVVYLLDFRSTNAYRLGPLFWIFPAFWAFLAFKTVHSIAPDTGWYALRHNLHMGFGLFFAGVEFVRRDEDIRLPIYAMALCGFVQGLDGIWQAVTHYDLIHGTPLSGGRLTGSFSTYRVGNLIALYLLPMAGLFWVLPWRLGAFKRAAITAVALFPALFLLAGARTRSAVVGVAMAVLAAWFFRHRSWWRYIVLVLIGLVLLHTFGPERFSLQGCLHDPRIRELWPLALQVFGHWPLLGAGVNTFNPAFLSLGLKPVLVSSAIPHPHNIYLQLLCETGVAGFAFFASMVFLFLRYALRHLFERTRAGQSLWVAASLFIATYIGYLGTAISGHNFFRTWWLGTAVLLLGLGLGFCVASERKDFRTSRGGERA